MSNSVIGLKGAIESFQLWDELGNCCAAALFRSQGNAECFDLLLWDFNSAIPRVVVGSRELCNNFMRSFHDRKVADGFLMNEQP